MRLIIDVDSPRAAPLCGQVSADRRDPIDFYGTIELIAAIERLAHPVSEQDDGDGCSKSAVCEV